MIHLFAEELNSIVGNAFRMAYAAQLQRQPTFQEVIASQLQDSSGWQKNISSTIEMNVKIQDHPPSIRLSGGKDPPKSIPGLKAVYEPSSNQSTPTSEESNSPTDLNSYKRLSEKPPLIKRLALGLTNNERTEDSRPLVTPVIGTTTSPVHGRPLSGGYVNEAVTETEFNKKILQQTTKQIDNNDANKLFQNFENENKSKRISQISSSSSGSCPPTGTIRPPPPPPERIDSLTGKAEEGELRAAPWFQAGIPREITLEVLGQEPVGAFMVRESTSKPGCYALSLRVPRDFQPSGIAHYLIMRTMKGYKIKGFTKEFTTLTALITHHSVMPELLPCPLSLSRFNASFTQTDSNRDFPDTDSDPDYDTLADFRRMMADLNV
ncbi:conserved hypothetical protein [Pediculus humanus corporis]|uniref:SH2 domain-containing protein n=1 Tax=Pediculus humanus subsp. corporis TaxID=121224 RepID=E0W1K0_PEDHC|nr:uncharacterized protein Phum_PHUM577970 [Pediculus humanus corporis]EEB19506.1 conserved hypothetical protein [Pediculus humanus corporis]